MADEGLAAWAATLPQADVGALVDNEAGKAVQYVEGQGWIEAIRG